MKSPDLLAPVASEEEAEMAKVALRCLTTALDHSNAPRIVLVDENGEQTDAPALILPPQALRFFAEMLKRMAQQQPIVLMPQKHELTTQEAAAFLNVSRPFVIKEIEAGRLKCHKVNRHRRIEFAELKRYEAAQQKSTEDALQNLTAMSESLGMEF
ncbi:helix-turn-helix domain-containing protein [Polaromonas sp.]|uniref:helix-turn-helix domain-containing protein n=1 Tax=Polaromonas sp. TaxID=1869339 RepID=UPI002FCBD280